MLPTGGCPLYDGQTALHRCASHKVESPIRGRAKVKDMIKYLEGYDHLYMPLGVKL